MAGSVLILGVGNVLMADDALGPYVLAQLQAQYDFGGRVSVFDAGTPGLDLTIFLDGVETLIVVDALKARGAPGEVKAYRKEQILAGGPAIVMNPHEPTLREALLRLDVRGGGPRDVLLVGAIPQRVETALGLSDAVRAAVPAVVEQILRELLRVDAPFARKALPERPDVWWEPDVLRRQERAP